MSDYQPPRSPGLLRAAASKIGVGVAEYIARREAGLKWCSRCAAWHPLAEFGVNRAQPDGRATLCRAAKSDLNKQSAARNPRAAPTPNAERCAAWRQSRKAQDAAYLARERERVAAARRGNAPQARPTAPPAPEPPAAEEPTTVPVHPVVAALTAEWDAAEDRRRQAREARRAARRSTEAA